MWRKKYDPQWKDGGRKVEIGGIESASDLCIMWRISNRCNVYCRMSTFMWVYFNNFFDRSNVYCTMPTKATFLWVYFNKDLFSIQILDFNYCFDRSNVYIVECLRSCEYILTTVLAGLTSLVKCLCSGKYILQFW